MAWCSVKAQGQLYLFTAKEEADPRILKLTILSACWLTLTALCGRKHYSTVSELIYISQQIGDGGGGALTEVRREEEKVL